tara:strand:+ start:104 stop:1210 length:1107 start_codon:yes stop_codon:yes gene_type:complete
MKNNFYTKIPLSYYSQFNKAIYPRIISGDNDINKNEIKKICNDMLNYIKKNKIKPSRAKMLNIVNIKNKDSQIKIKEYIKDDIPFVIRGLDLNIFNNYNFDILYDKVGNEYVYFSPSPPECLDNKYDKLDKLKENKCYLSNSTNLFKKYPDIFNTKDVNKLEKLSGGKMNSKQMFIGIKKDSGTGLHCAYTNNFFINVDGEKKWTLFNPNNAPLLYPHFSKYGIYNTSQSRFMSFEKTDISNFPLLKYVDYYEYTIKPGEILYNPASWWHSVENKTEKTFALSTRWEFRFGHLLDSHMLRCGNLNNKNLRNLVYKLYKEYGIMGINVIDEHNVMGNDFKDNKITPLWDKLTNDNHLLCYKEKCYKNWH